MSSPGSDTRRIVLDTSAYSRFRAGVETAVEAVAEASVVHVPVTVLGELEAGFLLGSRYRENRTTLEAFLAEPWVTVVPVTPSVAARYGDLFARLRRAGTPVPMNDVWIAAAALEVGARLVTFDGDFRAIPLVDVLVLG